MTCENASSAPAQTRDISAQTHDVSDSPRNDFFPCGQVVRLDRGFPLVRFEDGSSRRCKHAMSLVKGAQRVRAVIGDYVRVNNAAPSDMALIEEILPRTRELVRKDPTERAVPQVLAANFDRVIVAQPIQEVNLRRLERELVLAHETGAAVSVVLTKADLAESDERVRETLERVRALAGTAVDVFVVSAYEERSVEAVRNLIANGQMAVLIGRSGVGKSSLINLLVGCEVQATGEVRATDGRGRHTTVSREMIEIPGGGCVVDMPGVRGLGLWEADAGIETAFPDIEALAQTCKFRDCKHHDEPGCAVRAAVESGQLAQARFESYCDLRHETAVLDERREQARWAKRENARDSARGNARENARENARGNAAVLTGGSAGGRRTSAPSSKQRQKRSGRGHGGSSWRNKF